MSKHKWTDRICCIAIVLSMVLALFMMKAESLGVTNARLTTDYERTLFDTSKVHTIDIVMDDWDEFISECTSEEYSACSVIIDNEAYKNVAIRAKGNTSLTQVASYGNGRYSFKIEFDHYDSTKNYYGLDKLCLNNIIQDNTYMKDYLCYQMMSYYGVDSPLCSFVYITVNGEDWGLYLAVEGIEDAFLERNYGADYGNLYKPDSQSNGGGAGKDEGDRDPANMDKNMDGNMNGNMDGNADSAAEDNSSENTEKPAGNKPGNGDMQPPEGMEQPGNGEMKEPGGNGDKGGMSMGSDDVSLIYSDDEYSSYSNIFDNAKTDISDDDKDRLIASLKALNEGENIEDVVNVDEVIRYFVVHNFTCNFDSYTGSMIHNYYLYEKDGQLSMIPWDYNLAFGGFQNAEDATALVNYPIDDPVSGGTIDSRPMLAWIFANEEYTEMYHQYFAEFISDFFDSGYFEEMIDEVHDLIAPYVEKDPTKFCTYEEFETGISTLKEFCLLRAKSISGQLNGSIPSTSEEQNQNSDSLISAENITISDMGSMNNNQGGMGGPGGNGGPNMEDASNDEGAPDMGNTPNREGTPDKENAPNGEGAPDMGNTPNREGTPDKENAPNGEGAPDMGNAPNGEGVPNKGNGPNGENNPSMAGTSDSEEKAQQ